MGRAITELAQARQDIKIAAGIDKFPSSCTYPVFPNFTQLNTDGDVIIDFSRPDMLSSLLEYAVKNNMPAVLDKTGKRAHSPVHVGQYVLRRQPYDKPA